ncbi:cysteine hydrolase family protein [Chloroflexota bacterium]
MKKESLNNVLLLSKNRPFVMEPISTAFVVVDMQYATACRSAGLGRFVKEAGQAKMDSMEYRFGRIEKVAIPNIQKLLDFFRKHKLRVIYLTNGSAMSDYSDLLPYRRAFHMQWNNTRGNREHEILDDIRPLPGECVINKTTSSAFNSTNIDAILSKAMGIEYLLFAGVSTDLCVENTARAAVDLGYKCTMVEDCCASAVEEYHNAALKHFRDYFGRVETTQAVIEELSSAPQCV